MPMEVLDFFDFCEQYLHDETHKKYKIFPTAERDLHKTLFCLQKIEEISLHLDVKSFLSGQNVLNPSEIHFQNHISS